MSALLLLIGTKTIPTTTESFHAKEKFKLIGDGGICSGFGDRFENDFLSGEGLKEDPIAGHDLYEYRLEEKSKDDSIIKELGGKEKVPSTLTGMSYLMENNILSKDCWNIFYIKNMSGILRAVLVDRRVGGCFVNARSVEDPYVWGAGGRVFSGNSLKL